jgi:hypothetical protein
MKKPMHVENEFLSRGDKLNWYCAKKGLGRVRAACDRSEKEKRKPA